MIQKCICDYNILIEMLVSDMADCSETIRNEYKRIATLHVKRSSPTVSTTITTKENVGYYTENNTSLGTNWLLNFIKKDRSCRDAAEKLTIYNLDVKISTSHGKSTIALQNSQDQNMLFTNTDTRKLFSKVGLITIQTEETLEELRNSCIDVCSSISQPKSHYSTTAIRSKNKEEAEEQSTLCVNKTQQRKRQSSETETFQYKRQPTGRCARPSLHMFIFELFLLIVLFGPIDVLSDSMVVSWNMNSDLVVFGQTAKLACHIANNDDLCAKFPIQWYGGKDYKLLCRNGECRNSAKHSEKKESTCRYILNIHNFSESDVNCEYTCSYANARQRRMLHLNDKQFAYIPSGQEWIVNKTKNTSKHLEIIVKVSKVYPIPVCYTAFQGRNISNYVDVIIKKRGIFHSLIFNMSYEPSKCVGQLKMQCKIANTWATPINEKLRLCTEEEELSTPIALTVVAVIACLIQAVLVVLVAWMIRAYRNYFNYRKTQKSSLNYNYTSAEKHIVTKEEDRKFNNINFVF